MGPSFRDARAGGTAGATAWMARPRSTADSRLLLLCLPFAGAGAAIFRSWPEILPDHISICPIRLPGRENRLTEPPCTRLAPLVRTLATEIAPHLDRPYAVFGHSMGALIGFELARELRGRFGHPPVQLIVSARPAPRLAPRHPPIHRLPDDAFIEQLCQYDGMPEEVLDNPELMELLLPTLRADFAIVETYEYTRQPPLDCPISVFGGTRDAKVRPEDLPAWRAETRGAFSQRMFEGGHRFPETRRAEFFDALTEALGCSPARIPVGPAANGLVEHNE